MATIPAVLLATLNDLDDKEFKKFTWHLLYSGLADNLIPEGDLKKADRSEAVVLMVQQYGKSDAGKIAIRALREMKQNERAKQLERKLIQFENQVQQPEQASVRKAPIHQPEQAGVRNAPIQQPEQMDVEEMECDWTRPGGITPCTPEFKNRILRENRDNIYILKEKSQRKRLALLITNIKFDHLSYRNAAARDEENMKWLLEELGYRVEKHRNLSGKEIDDKVKKFAAHSDHEASDSTFVVIMSHGGIIDNKDAILGVHYHDEHNPKDYFHVDDIFFHLNSENCRALIDKPKVILIQACRGEHKGGVEIQSDAIVHKEKDFISFKSSVPGVRSYRNPKEGSYFICYIVKVFCVKAHDTEIYELFTRVTSSMEKDKDFKHYSNLEKILPCIDRATLSKKLYLFPGL